MDNLGAVRNQRSLGLPALRSDPLQAMFLRFRSLELLLQALQAVLLEFRGFNVIHVDRHKDFEPFEILIESFGQGKKAVFRDVFSILSVQRGFDLFLTV